jgi:hypothetical protein
LNYFDGDCPISLSLPLQKQPLLFPVADVLQLLSKVMAYGDATLKDVKIKVCDANLSMYKNVAILKSFFYFIEALF